MSTFTFLLIASLVHWFTYVDSASLYRRKDDLNKNEFLQSVGISDAPKRKVIAPKYVMDLYNLMVDQNGDRKSGIRTNADKIRCYFPGQTKQNAANEMKFNINDIADDENIIRAELQLFKIRNQNKNNTKQQFIRVDIKDAENGITEAVRLLNSMGSGWKSFQLTETVKKWRKNHKTENKLRISLTRMLNSDSQVEFAGMDSEGRSPFLVVFTETKRRRQRNANLPIQDENVGGKLLRGERGARKQRGHNHNNQSCKRKSMVVDMKQIGWDRYIIAPQKFDAYRCEGRCRVYNSKAVKKQTDHSVLQAMLSQLGIKINGRPVRPPCCAPSQFESKTLLVHREHNGQSVISMEEFYDIVVKSCACL